LNKERAGDFMNRLRGTRSWTTVAALLLLPSVALAEVSVQLDSRGNYKRYWYLTAGRGRSAIVWKQVRPRLPLNVLLNPLGDTYGDRQPVIEVSPATGYPWVVWPKNFGNIRQLAFSTWAGRKWTEPALINPGVPLIYDDLDPALAIDQAGTQYLVWSRAEQTAKVYFSTLIQGRWTPALLISDASISSRAPSITLNGTTAIITFQTPAGPVTKNYQTVRLVESAASLMDNPIPPLNSPPATPPGGDPASGGTDGSIRKK
jgi:hypothetical protein